ncbi:hypothetical protein Dimus_024668, partial [Dionaea muscipula]
MVGHGGQAIGFLGRWRGWMAAGLMSTGKDAAGLVVIAGEDRVEMVAGGELL